MARTDVSAALDRTRAFSWLLQLRKRAPTSWLTVLTYHRVGDPRAPSLFDDGVVDASPAALDRQLSFLSSHCSLVSIDDVLEFREGKPLPPNPVLVTFDDGYKDNVTVALPILARHRVPAAFFLSTDYLTRRKLFWWDRISWHVKESTRETAVLSYPTPMTVRLGGTSAERADAAAKLMKPLKTHAGISLDRYLEEIESATGTTLTADAERAFADGLVMNWDDARRLSQAGMSVQSHTKTHRVLQTLDEAALEDEIAGSKAELEAQLGSPIDAIAYPVGKGLHTAPAARRIVRRAGYSLGFSNGTGVSALWRFDAYDVRRLSIDADVPDSYFHGMVALPYFAYEPHAHVRT